MQQALEIMVINGDPETRDKPSIVECPLRATKSALINFGKAHGCYAMFQLFALIGCGSHS